MTTWSYGSSSSVYTGPDKAIALLTRDGIEELQHEAYKTSPWSSQPRVKLHYVTPYDGRV